MFYWVYRECFFILDLGILNWYNKWMVFILMKVECGNFIVLGIWVGIRGKYMRSEVLKNNKCYWCLSFGTEMLGFLWDRVMKIVGGIIYV